MNETLRTAVKNRWGQVVSRNEDFRKKKLWHRYVNYVNTHKGVERQSSHKEFGIVGKQVSSRLDNYRWLLLRAGYIEQIRKGSYVLVKEIPWDLTSTKCRWMQRNDL